ncbi:MAG: hypothetical protein U0Q22_00885 [Acidimicrobiales bacterium]
MTRSVSGKVRLTVVAAAVAVASTSCVAPAWSHLFVGLGYQTCDFYAFEPVPAGMTESVVIPGLVSLGCTYE